MRPWIVEDSRNSRKRSIGISYWGCIGTIKLSCYNPPLEILFDCYHGRRPYPLVCDKTPCNTNTRLELESDRWLSMSVTNWLIHWIKLSILDSLTGVVSESCRSCWKNLKRQRNSSPSTSGKVCLILDRWSNWDYVYQTRVHSLFTLVTNSLTDSLAN